MGVIWAEPPTIAEAEAYKLVRSNQIINELIRKAKGDIPDDVLALAASILIDENASKVPAIHWRRSRKIGSTGRCYTTHVALTVSPVSSEDMVHLLTIHELSHWLLQGENHSPFFYEKAFELYDRYGVNMGFAQTIEFAYKSYSARLGYALYMRSIKGVRWTFADKSD